MIERLMTLLQNRRAAKDEQGASAVEYGLLIAGIAAVIIVAVMALGPVIREQFNDTCAAIAGNTSTTNECSEEPTD